MQEANRPITRILRRKEVETRTGLSRSSIYAYVKNGTFPSPVRLGPNSIGWILEDVDFWISTKCEGSRRDSRHLLN
jgi:prophage regulatory protein